MIIQTKNMYKYIDAEKKLPILSDINVEIQEGEFVSIMGPSGSGKSTLLGILAGIDSATQGSVYIEEQDITKLSEKQICKFRNKNIGMVLQAPNLIETITIGASLLEPFMPQTSESILKPLNTAKRSSLTSAGSSSSSKKLFHAV